MVAIPAVAHANAGRRMLLDARSKFARILGAAGLVVSTGCYSEPPPEPDPRPPISTIEILPWRVTVVKDAEFTVHARVKDEYGNTLPDDRAEEVHWKSTDASLVVSSGPSATVAIAARPGDDRTLPIKADVIAYVGSVTRTASITVVAPASPPDPDVDWIAGRHAAKDYPIVALVNGIATHGTSSAPLMDEAIPFVLESPVDTLDCPDNSHCGAVAVFSPGNAVARSKVKWVRGCDFVGVADDAVKPSGCGAADQTGGTISPLQPPVPISVAVWNASKVLAADVGDDINYARRVYLHAGAGIALEVALKSQIAPRELEYDDAAGCYGPPHDVPAQLPELDFQPKRITVVYVEDVNASGGSISGFTCTYDPSNGTVIVLVGHTDGASKLAHEIGHALGQWRPPAPIHTDEWSAPLDGMDPSNLLWSADVEGGGGPRRFLTLGQIFQISFNNAGFITTAQLLTTQRLTCATDPTANLPCPPLAKDVAH